MANAQIVSIALNFVLGIISVIFAKEYKKFKNSFVTTAEAVKDDRVTWDEAKEIVKELEE